MRWELSQALSKLSSWEQLPEGRLWVLIRWPEASSFGGKCSIRVSDDSQRIEALPVSAPVDGMLPSCVLSISLNPVIDFIYNTSEDEPFFPEQPDPRLFADWLILKYPLQGCDTMIAHLQDNAMP